jgi:ATP-dependent DNA helicase RecQ
MMKSDKAFDAFRKWNNANYDGHKAFGMGVDVDDVKNVYHYAVTGNLNDYVQEVGRAARISTMEGKAIIDYYYNDMSFMKKLLVCPRFDNIRLRKFLKVFIIHIKVKVIQEVF